MSNVKELFEKLGGVFSDLDAVKVSITIGMLLELIDFIQEAYEDFSGDSELTEEEQKVLYDKYDAFYELQKAAMKEKIAAARAITTE